MRKQTKNELVNEFAVWVNNGCGAVWQLDIGSQTFVRKYPDWGLAVEGDATYGYIVAMSDVADIKKWWYLGEDIQFYDDNNKRWVTWVSSELPHDVTLRNASWRRKPKEWYHNIPEQGVLCWVWDDEYNEKVPSTIVRYNPDSSYPFRDKWYIGRMNAEPITGCKEIEEYIYKGGGA